VEITISNLKSDETHVNYAAPNRAGGVGQVVEHFVSKCEDLRSNPVLPKTKTK
jgi:hypothetical protein